MLYADVKERWGGDHLAQHPYLTYFAEMKPEHLNEVGVALIADKVCDILYTQTKSE